MDLKRFAAISPVILGFIIFLGYVNLFIYYNHWDIRISHFINISEVLTLFLDDLNIIAFLILLMIVHMTIGFIGVNSLEKAIATTTELEANDQKSSPVNSWLDETYENSKSMVWILLIASLIFFGVFLLFKNLVTLYFTFILSIQLFALTIDKVLKIKNVKIELQLLFITSLTAFTCCIPIYNISETEKNDMIYSFKMKDNDKVITTGGRLLFLGKTERYIFVYDGPNEVVTIFPMESIDHLYATRKTH